MSIQLRNDETIVSEVNFHWLIYMRSIILALFGAVVFYASPFWWLGLVFLLPAVYLYFANKFKRYVVTNQRLYIQEGIIARHISEIPLRRINSVEFSQNIPQRIFGAGTVIIFTGNDAPVYVVDIDNPHEFKNAISDMVETLIGAGPAGRDRPGQGDQLENSSSSSAS